MKWLDFFKINHQLLLLQSRLIAVLVLVILLVSQLKVDFFQPEFSVKSLQININTATQQQLESVPYIGEKTAQIIIQIRQTEGRFTDINQLKFLPNFDKFRYYIKTEE